MPSTALRERTPVSQGGLDRFFKITQRGSTVAREVRGGLVTFATMAYIVVLNPILIGNNPDSTGAFLGGSQDGNAAKIAAATALVAGIMTILMGVVANYPLALATGLGLNVFVATGIATLPHMTWADAMGLIVLEGLIILVLVLTGFRTAVFRAIPAQLKTAISVGIGLFITLVGLVDAGVITKPAVGPVPVQLGLDGSLDGWPILLFVIVFVGIVAMHSRKINGSLLYGIVGGTVLGIIFQSLFHIGALSKDNPHGWQLNVPTVPHQWLATPDFSLLGHFSLLGSFTRIGVIATVLLVFTLLLADFFDTMGTMVAIGGEAGLLDKDGNPPSTQRILVVDSLAAAAGGAAGVSSNTSYIESASGVGAGARTGLASVVTGVLFLLATFLAPLVKVVPHEAATPALVFVGFLMMQQVKGISWDDIEIAIPAFLTVVFMPLTYSITAGIGAGFVVYTIIKLVRGKAAQVHPLMWVVSALFVVYFAIDPIKSLFGVS
ncbi:MAG TPA: NCS2 family permease [Segeticoccus sp.]|uniref:NCS2 family permease n=1 Tax=Segeticoccus sp. TaxID=2706531 RepID=UPI002D7FDAEB|nr:NCS2 family permease [Segeticoccus sp.]HET8601093.1 NCS2 family permease [Segeticoccus sp.]